MIHGPTTTTRERPRAIDGRSPTCLVSTDKSPGRLDIEHQAGFVRRTTRSSRRKIRTDPVHRLAHRAGLRPSPPVGARSMTRLASSFRATRRGDPSLPLVCSPSQVAPLLGRSDHAIRDDCVAGVIPTLPRAGGSGAHHRIATARLLDQIGVPYEIVSSEKVSRTTRRVGSYPTAVSPKRHRFRPVRKPTTLERRSSGLIARSAVRRSRCGYAGAMAAQPVMTAEE